MGIQYWQNSLSLHFSARSYSFITPLFCTLKLAAFFSLLLLNIFLRKKYSHLSTLFFDTRLRNIFSSLQNCLLNKDWFAVKSFYCQQNFFFKSWFRIQLFIRCKIFYFRVIIFFEKDIYCSSSVTFTGFSLLNNI